MAEQTYALAKSGVYGQANGAYVDALSAIPDSGVSRWTFDDADTESGTAIDTWGSNDGTINGATTGVSGANQTYTTNEAYDFGSDDFVDFGDVYDLTGGYSLAVWANFDDVSNARVAYAAGTSGGYQSIIRADSGSIVYFHNHSGGAGEISGSSISTDTWYHCVLTWDGSTAVAYLDGSSDGSLSADDVSNPADTHYVGRRVSTDGEYLDGTADDPRVYNKALSSTEVSDLYNTGSI